MQRIGARRRWAVVAAGAVLMAGLPLLRGQEPKPAPAKAEARARQDLDQPAWAKLTEDSIKPLPMESIPDDPPPHEGALLEISYRIEQPDLILVEVLEALAGRPIAGERLVHPNGMVSLGWYGDVHVAGLTPEQAKAKIVLHLRAHLTDQALGLIEWNPRGDRPAGKRGPFPADPFPVLPPMTEDAGFDGASLPRGNLELLPMPRSVRLEEPAEEQAARPGADKPLDRPGGKNDRPSSDPFGYILPNFPLPKLDRPAGETSLPSSDPFNYTLPNFPLPKSEMGHAPSLPSPVPAFRLEKTRRDEPVLVAQGHVPMENAPSGGPGFVYVDPARTIRVFVEVSAYNSKVYYVQGDVGNPGRLPYTGKETVFDAVNFAGGLLTWADRHNIRLYRPARGGKPARSYRIDYNAIERGDKKANLQLFPDDRLIIERKENFEPRP